MNVAEYRRRREALKLREPPVRVRCITCLQPEWSCFCAWLRPFTPPLEFVILTHPIEVKRRRIVTGRMSHLSLSNSILMMGHDFTGRADLDRVLDDPARHCVMLYPGRSSVNLTPLSLQERRARFTPGKRPTVVVIDGTWSTARKMVHLSRNLKRLPRVCFTPSAPSAFRVRQQPRPECVSTIEAIHQTLELFKADGSAREHDSLLEVFERMVNRQIDLAHGGTPSRRRPQVLPERPLAPLQP
ncbi:MAG TPA: tRNA-uridine aminocarboxypropyltransferase [Bdellovibrionales bacterium]|nr:tRNA-uridine aminocarboxypropyltransferase [Bdellovibrionales bacterium]